MGAKRPVWPVRDAEGKALGDEDLVGLLLTGGKVDGRASELARALLSHAGGLASLPEVERSTLMHLGLGENQAAAVRAACEIWVRLAWVRIARRRSEARLHQLAQFVALRYQNPDQEVMVVLYMDARHRVQSEQEVARGSCNQAEVERRTILRECLLRSARGFVLCHTHPSGQLAPSDADLRFTRVMIRAADAVGLELVDHLVVGKGGEFLSIRWDGYLEGEGGW